MKRRSVLAIFLVLQLVGTCCLGLRQHVPSALSMPMWGTALIVLFPGNFLGGWIVETLLWRSRLPLIGMGLLSVLAAVVINAVIWLVVAKGARTIYAHLSLRSGISKAT